MVQAADITAAARACKLSPTFHANALIRVAVLLAVTLGAGCRTPEVAYMAPVFAEPGTEQEVCDTYARKWERPDPQQFQNVLDYVFSVLTERAFPTPDGTVLTRAVTQAMAEVATGAKDDSSTHLGAEWAEAVAAAGSFEAVLVDSVWADPGVRDRGNEAGLRAMMMDVAWLIPAEQASVLRDIVSGRQGAETGPPASFTLRRIRPDVVHVVIPTFEDKDIGYRVVEALRKEMADGVGTVLIDLRDNPGGRPEQADAIADLFLDGRPLQILCFADGRRVTFVSHAGASDATVAVLVNRQTGSGGEMLAMALRDNGRALLVGEPTAGALFGKDFAELPDGRMVVFRCEPTVLSATGVDYSLAGIPPDKLVGKNGTEEEDPVVAAALKAVSPTSASLRNQ